MSIVYEQRRPKPSTLEGSRPGLYNQWRNLGNTEARFPDLLNELAELRRSARYLKREFQLDQARATEYMATIDAMRVHVEEVRPKAELDDEAKPRSYQVIAARDLRSGQIVGPRDWILFR